MLSFPMHDASDATLGQSPNSFPSISPPCIKIRADFLLIVVSVTEGIECQWLLGLESAFFLQF